MRWIKSFENEQAIQNALDSAELLKPYVAYDESGETIDYNSKAVDYSKIPLTFEITEGGDVVWRTNKTGATHTIEYSKNGGEWTSITSNVDSAATHINVLEGDIIQFRGDNVTYYVMDIYLRSSFRNTCGFKVKGNIMSLIDSTNFATATTLESAYTFTYLFDSCTGLTDASNLVLPATTLAEKCYSEMFYNCSNLVSAPSILPATTLVEGCYWYMFDSCSAMTSAPELPATTLAKTSYYGMFFGCSSLNYIKCLATDISASSCTGNWVKNVASTGTFVKNSSMNDWTTGNNGIPTDWTVENA